MVDRFWHHMECKICSITAILVLPHFVCPKCCSKHQQDWASLFNPNYKPISAIYLSQLLFTQINCHTFFNLQMWLLLSDLRSWGTSMGAAWRHSSSSNNMRARAACPPCPNISPPPMGGLSPHPSWLVRWFSWPLHQGPVCTHTETDGYGQDSGVDRTLYLQYKLFVFVDVYSVYTGTTVCVDSGLHSQLSPCVAP